MAVFEIKLTPYGEYHFRLLDTENNKTLLSGRRYTTKNACWGGICFVKNNAPYDYQYEKKDSTGEYHFNLKASDGKVIGTSETYATSAARDNEMRLVKAHATRASVTDLT